MTFWAQCRSAAPNAGAVDVFALWCQFVGTGPDISGVGWIMMMVVQIQKHNKFDAYLSFKCNSMSLMTNLELPWKKMGNDIEWITCVQRIELLHIWLQNETVIANRILYNKYRNKHINKVRNKYIKKEVSANIRNSRKLWEFINLSCGKVRNSVDTIISYFKSSRYTV